MKFWWMIFEQCSSVRTEQTAIDGEKSEYFTPSKYIILQHSVRENRTIQIQYKHI